MAEVGGEPRGLVAAALYHDGGVGEIYIIAVDPGAQGLGVRTALTGVAASWLRQPGMLVAMIGTGGDPGHAPARRACEKAAAWLSDRRSGRTVTWAGPSPAGLPIDRDTIRSARISSSRAARTHTFARSATA